MKVNYMLGLVAVSLLASCGLVKTTIPIGTDTRKAVVPGSGVGGGALGIDGKGAPLDLSKGNLLTQGVNTNKVLASGNLPDITDQTIRNNISRLSEWGFSQDAPSAVLSGTDCPASFSATDTSFTATISDTLGQTARTASATIPVGTIVFAAKTANSCEYNVTVNNAPLVLLSVLSNNQIKTLGEILTSGSTNTGELKGSFTVPASVEGRTLTIQLGGSSSYVVVTVI
ncbi:MAG: hypothetical protein ACK41E_07970 [Deinococcales bacterium]